jgi:hypothetical protein
MDSTHQHWYLSECRHRTRNQAHFSLPYSCYAINNKLNKYKYSLPVMPWAIVSEEESRER